jgi:hypothetical protein
VGFATLDCVHRESKRRRALRDSPAEAVKRSLEKKEKQSLVRLRVLLRVASFLFAMPTGLSLLLLGLPSYAQMGQQAQMGPEAGSELNGTGPMASPSPSNTDMPAPVQNMHIPQPVRGSMIVTPPYGSAPLRVGFFVLANDPEGLGFLTYSWNFGDGTVSSLPPELYISHTYQNPGSYVCELTTTTVDGRKNSFFQGVIVEPPTH